MRKREAEQTEKIVNQTVGSRRDHGVRPARPKLRDR